MWMEPEEAAERGRPSFWYGRHLAHLETYQRSGTRCDGRRLALAQRVVDARHDGEVEAHLALGVLVGAEVVDDLVRHLVGLGQQDPTRVLGVDHPAQRGGGTGGSWGGSRRCAPLLLEQVGHGVQAEAVVPMSIQNRTMSNISSWTRGFSD